jgi:anti-anti-sigma regulatory factor
MNSKLASQILAVLLLLWPSGALSAQTSDEVRDLRKQIEGLEQVISSLKHQVDAMEKRLSSPAAPNAPQPDSPTAPPSTLVAVTNPLSQRETSRRDAETVARVDNAPLDSSRKGYILIPGTQSSFKISGYAKMDMIIDPKLAGNPDQFLTSSIPIGIPSGANTSSFNLHGRQTRFNLDFQRPGTLGPLRVFLEADFFGSEGPTAFRMRHAYGQARNVLVGWTWSTLADADAFPDTLDNMSPNGAAKTRQPQVRYTVPGLLIVRPVGRIYFGNAENAGVKLRALIAANSPRVVLLDCSATPGFEYTALKMLAQAEAQFGERGTQLWLAALNPEALELVRRTPLAERLGRERMFITVEQGVAAFEGAARP